MHQGTGLVQMLQGKGDTEFDWRQGDAPFEETVGLVESADLLSPLPVVRGFFELPHHLWRNIVDHFHAIGRHIPPRPI